MIYSEFRFTLDIRALTSQVSLGVKKGETGRRLRIHLTENGYPYHIPDNCYAVFTAKKPDGNKIFNDCVIQDCEIFYDLTEQTVSTTGLLPCAINLYGVEGELLISATFQMIVYSAPVDRSDIESTSEYKALATLIAEAQALKDDMEEGGTGGYYLPEVEQVDDTTLRISFTPSSEEMPAVDPAEVKLPEYSGNDSTQNVELDTTLTQSGKAADAKAVGDALASKLDSVMVSPDGSKWRISISNDGVLTSEKIIIEVPATGISLSASTLTFNNSANQTIKATLTPADSTDAVIWETSNPDVATVSNGVVTPIGNGSCTITATAGSVSASCAVTVDVAVVETYSITRNITNATGFDDSTAIGAGSELLECYISNDECTMDGATATVTMGGEDITETAWDNGVVNIAEVTGDVVITLDAVKIQYVVPPIEDFTISAYDTWYHLTKYNGTEEAIELPTTCEVDGKSYVLKLYGFSVSSSVKHIKVPADMQVWRDGNMDGISGDKAVLRTVYIAGEHGYFSPSGYTVLEKHAGKGGTKCYGCTGIRTLQNVTYPDTVTTLKETYGNCTALVDGGVIPAHITNIRRAFYGCTNLKRVRIETTADGTADNDGAYYQTFYGVSNAEITLPLSSGLWKCLRTEVGLTRKYKFIDGEPFNRIVCIGDSLTRYGTALRDLIPLNASATADSNPGGTSLNIYNKMIQEPHKSRLSDSIPIIWHGTNGAGSGETLITITEKMVAALDGNQRYLLIPPTAQGEGDEVYESWVATYGEEHVLSMGDWFANNGYTVSDYQTDGTHFTADGYALIAQAVYEKIQQWL